MIDPLTVGFEVGDYDKSRPLIINPLHTRMPMHLAGQNGALSLPSGRQRRESLHHRVNQLHLQRRQATTVTGNYAFTVKLNPAGNAMLYATYIGGRGDDSAAASPWTDRTEAIIAGVTASTNFPLVTGHPVPHSPVAGRHLC